MSSQRRATSRDVAARAGVSVATVSYVVNGLEGRVGAKTRDRVLAAVSELGYAPNSSARGLRTQRTEQFCLVTDEIGVPANDQLARDLHDAADRIDYGVMTLLADSPTRARQVCDALRARIADGVVVISRHLEESDIATLARLGLPMVVMSNTLSPTGFDVVRTPVRSACAEAVDHLCASGRRRIAFIGHDYELTTDSARMRAYTEVLTGYGLAVDPALLVTGANDRVSGYRAAHDLLTAADPPDGIFAASDRSAISAIWAARDAGRNVPDDVAIVGVGNLPEGLIVRPRLSTVGPPVLDYSDVARLLLDRIEDPGREPVEHTLTWNFIARESA